jgi:hypothetical protein
MRPDRLDVISVLSNLPRWKVRPRLALQFAEHMVESGVRLTLVECAYGEIPHALPDIPGVRIIRKRARTPAWNKEALFNLGVQHLPEDAKYIALIDADIEFRRKDWAAETVYALQHHHVVQPWDTCYDLGPNGEHVELHKSFCHQWVHAPHTIGKKSGYDTFAHPGYAWALTMQAFEWLGGFVETGVAGAGDHHQALALVNKAEASFPGGISDGYKLPIRQWQERAQRHVNKLIHYVPGTIMHSWHGRKKDRAYIDRWQILVKHAFDPATDLKRNAHGVLEFCGNKPELLRDMHAYMTARNEDCNVLA